MDFVRGLKHTLALGLMSGFLCAGVMGAQSNTPFKVDGVAENYDLTTHLGASFDPSIMSGKVVLLVFGFTTCPDICPTELSRVSQVLSAFEGEAVDAIFVSLDPDRDTVEKLAVYLPYFHDDITGLTGKSARIDELASSLGVRYGQIEQGSTYTIDHSTGVFVLGSDGEVKAIAPLGSGIEHLKSIVANLL